MRNIVPRIPGVNTLGTPAKRWGAIYADQIVLPDNKTLLEILSGQDTTIEEVLGQQNLTITNRLAAQDAEIESRLGAQESTISQLSDEKVDKTEADETYVAQDDVLTLEEIEASTIFNGEVASAEALATINRKTTGNWEGTITAGANYARRVYGTWTRIGNVIHVQCTINASGSCPAGGTISGTVKGFPSGISFITRSVGWYGTCCQVLHVSESEFFYRPFISASSADTNISGTGLIYNGGY